MERRNFLKITLPAALTGRVVAEGVEPMLSFGVIADPQYVDAKARGSRHYRESLGKLKMAVTELNKHELKFVITLGDIIDRDLTSFDDIMPVYEGMKAPNRFVPGNHDFSVKADEKEKVLGKLGLEKAYDSETFGDWHFISLDGNDVSTYRYGPDHPMTAEAKMLRTKLTKEEGRKAAPYCGAIGKTQFAWFSAELEKAKAAGKRVIVFCHFPAFPFGDNHNLWNDDQVVNLIAKYPNVVAYMNGHRHSGEYAVNEGCHYINYKGMVETMEKSAYAVVKCFADRIEVDGYETEPDRTCGFGGK